MAARFSWKAISRGDQIPHGAISGGRSSKDGEVFVGRHGAELGKLNTDGGRMHNIWCHSGGDTKDGEILIVTDGAPIQWVPVKKGGSVPPDAVNGGSNGLDGDIIYPCRKAAGGAVGKLNSKDGKVNSLWFHGDWFAKSDGDILVVGPVGADESWAKQYQHATVGRAHSTPGIAGRKRGFDEVLDDHCTCPVCMEVFDEKVFQCSNGHVVCESCHIKIVGKPSAQQKCPQCNIILGSFRNLIVENIVRAAPRPCRHACGALGMDYDTRKQHQKDCTARPYKCPMCHVEVTPNNAEQHLVGAHSILWGQPLSVAPCSTIRVTKPNDIPLPILWNILCKVPGGGKACLLAADLTQTGFRALLVAPSGTVAGTVGGGPSFYTMTVKGQQRSFTFSGPIRHARDLNAAKDANDCLFVPKNKFLDMSGGTELQFWCDNESGCYNFDLELIVSVTDQF